MSGKIEISREQLERWVRMAEVFDDGGDGADPETSRTLAQEIRQMLAAPVVERQEPVGEVLDMKYNCVKFYRATGDTSKPYLLPGTKLYTSPPAPVEVALPERPLNQGKLFDRMSSYEKGIIQGAAEMWDKLKELNQ